MSRFGRWSYVCTCGWSSRRRSLATIHVTVQRGKAHRIAGL